ncbi:MAG: hypothetical protein HC896_11680 [Bacteroidales bacterium]|nr:hypothetical protein [Bacteroidales bacterium]
MLAAFVCVLVSQIKVIGAQFYALMQAQYDMLAFTGQVCYLQYLLNREYGHGIIIDDASMFDDVYEFQLGEYSPDTYEYAIEDEPIADPKHDYLYYQSADYATQKSFIIRVPYDNIYINEIKAMVERYRMPSKRFEIFYLNHERTKIIPWGSYPPRRRLDLDAERA